ncbi:uncharacterized protein LOC121677190 [Arvicola amphibius]|uniref:uncharacterized protein LOC121677190 n=1 Tax=Arvicola amphibius TaxID=1047088 RepID=UPI001C08C5F3|nr:uncharacterized protein LOC121677190 [Arvicola amphibius]
MTPAGELRARVSRKVDSVPEDDAILTYISTHLDPRRIGLCVLWALTALQSLAFILLSWLILAVELTTSAQNQVGRGGPYSRVPTLELNHTGGKLVVLVQLFKTFGSQERVLQLPLTSSRWMLWGHTLQEKKLRHRHVISSNLKQTSDGAREPRNTTRRKFEATESVVALKTQYWVCFRLHKCLCLYAIHVLYPFSCGWTSRLAPVPGYCG